MLAAALPVGLAFGLLSTRRLTRRLKRLAALTLEVADGDFERRVRVSGRDEVSLLEENFNRMAGQLQASLDANRRFAEASARHEERSRIARELHDAISQELFSLSVLAGGLRRSLPAGSPVLPEVETMERTAGGAMREMRSLLLALRPVALEEADLAGAIEGVCHAYSDRLGIPVRAEFELAGLGAAGLPPAVEHAVLRVTQEAVANAARHAGPGQVTVLLQADSRQARLEVTDDGRGFDVVERARRRRRPRTAHDARPGHRARRPARHRQRAGRGHPGPRLLPAARDRRCRGRGHGGGPMIRVLIADDHKVVRQGLRFLLSSEPGIEVAGEAADGSAALDAIRAMRPDVVLLDLFMPRLDGLGVLDAMSEEGLTAAVLVLTSSPDDQHLVAALKAGALSYLPKTAGVDQVIDAVRAAARGESVLQPAATARLLRELRQATADPLAQLTPRETDVLKGLAQGRSNREIARVLSVSEETVKSHVSSILAKLGLADRTQAAIFALQRHLVPLDRALEP